ncbi:tetratricopeptide repeat protein [Candidatus Woesearchaeota archaeon]|nr:tetratricopeptide repeat protein [Candidatus Woesearchaeota archaeon]
MPPTISFCMIAKNEEAYIADCLNSVKGLAKEMIVVDTGSADKTVEIAEQCGATVHHFPWNGSFADARNESIKYATGDWILVLDADEAISLRDHDRFRALTEQSSVDGYLLQQLNYTNDSTRLRWEPCSAATPESKAFTGFVPCPICRFYRNKPTYRYRYKIHEMINESILDHGGRIELTGLPIHHYKAFKTKEETMEKAGRYLQLLEQQIRDNPHDPKTYYEYGQLLLNLKRPEEARAALLKVHELEHTAKYAYSAIGFLQYLLAQACLQTSRPDEAIDWLKKGIAHQPKSKNCYLLLGNVLIQQKKFQEAFSVMDQAIANGVSDNAIHNTLGVLFLQLGMLQDAVRCFEYGRGINVGINPAIEKINNNLFACYLQLGRIQDAEELLEQAIKETPRVASYYANLAQQYGRSGKAGKAREKLEKIRELWPEQQAYIDQKLHELGMMEKDSMKGTGSTSSEGSKNSTIQPTSTRQVQA